MMSQEISRVLEHYGAEDVPTGGKWQPMKCCFHEDRHASARVSPDDGAFACLACGIKGDALAVIMKVEKIEFVCALERYEAITGSPAKPVSSSVQRQPGRRVYGRERNYDGDSGLFSSGVRRKPSAGR